MFTDILAGSLFSSLPDTFLLFCGFDYTHMLPVGVFSPPEARKKAELCLSASIHPSIQTNRQTAWEEGEGGRHVGVGFTSLGSQLTGERSLAIYHCSLGRLLTMDSCFVLILSPQKGSRQRRNSALLSKPATWEENLQASSQRLFSCQLSPFFNISIMDSRKLLARRLRLVSLGLRLYRRDIVFHWKLPEPVFTVPERR